MGPEALAVLTPLPPHSSMCAAQPVLPSCWHFVPRASTVKCTPLRGPTLSPTYPKSSLTCPELQGPAGRRPLHAPPGPRPAGRPHLTAHPAAGERGWRGARARVGGLRVCLGCAACLATACGCASLWSCQPAGAAAWLGWHPCMVPSSARALRGASQHAQWPCSTACNDLGAAEAGQGRPMPNGPLHSVHHRQQTAQSHSSVQQVHEASRAPLPLTIPHHPHPVPHGPV